MYRALPSDVAAHPLVAPLIPAARAVSAHRYAAVFNRDHTSGGGSGSMNKGGRARRHAHSLTVATALRG